MTCPTTGGYVIVALMALFFGIFVGSYVIHLLTSSDDYDGRRFRFLAKKQGVNLERARETIDAAMK